MVEGALLNRFAAAVAVVAAGVVALAAAGGLARADTVTRPIAPNIVGLAEYLAPAGPGGRGPVLVLVHDVASHKDAELVRRFRNALAARGIGVVTPTLTLGVDRRAGTMDCRRTQVHRLDQALPEIGEWVAFARDTRAGPVFVGGIGMGANLVTRWQAKNPEPGARGLVLVDVEPDGGQAARAADFQSRTGAALTSVLAEAQSMHDSQRGTKGFDVPAFLVCAETRVSAETFLSYYGPDPERDTLALVRRIGRPTMLVAGGADPKIRDLSRRIADLAAAAPLHFQVVPRATPEFPATALDEAADLIAAFLLRNAK